MNNAVVETVAEREVDEVGHCLMAALLEAARNVQQRLEQALEAVALTPAKYQALAVLVEAGTPLALGELAGRLNCVKSNVTQLVDRLESDGLVRRVDDVSDRRAIHAIVTPLGTERQLAGARAMSELRDEFSVRVSSAEKETFRRVLDILRQ